MKQSPAQRRRTIEPDEPIPAVRFFGEHRYFGTTGELITKGVIEVTTIIGRDAIRDDYFVCGGQLRSITQPNCPRNLCTCIACLIDHADEDDPRSVEEAKKQCRCVKCRRRKRTIAKSLVRSSGRGERR